MLCDDLEEWGGGVGGRLKREGIQLTHTVVRKKLTQSCKAIILQLNFFKKIDMLSLDLGTCFSKCRSESAVLESPRSLLNMKKLRPSTKHPD